MTQDELNEIKARVVLAQAGPWQAQVTEDGYLRVTDDPDAVNGICGFGDMEETDRDDHYNALFIAHTRTDIPALLRELAALTAERDGLRVRIRDVAWAALKYEDATYKVKTYKSNGQYKRQLKIIHNILKAAQAEFGPEE